MQSRHLNRAVTELEHSLAMAPEQTRLFRQSSTKTTYDGVRVCMSCQVAGWTHGRTDGILPDACGRHVRVSLPALYLCWRCLSGQTGCFFAVSSTAGPSGVSCFVSRARSLASAFPLANGQPVTNKVQHMTDRPVCTSTVTSTSNCAVAQPRTHAHTHIDTDADTRPRGPPVYVVIMVLRVMAVTCCL